MKEQMMMAMESMEALIPEEEKLDLQTVDFDNATVRLCDQNLQSLIPDDELAVRTGCGEQNENTEFSEEFFKATDGMAYIENVLDNRLIASIYVDAKGQEMQKVLDHSEYGVKMMGNYTLPSLDVSYMAPGGQSAFTDIDGKMYVVYHQRFDDGTEGHEPRVHQLFVNENGWLVAAPFAASGETLSEKGYRQKDLTGTYYILNHGPGINAKVKKGKEVTLHADGNIDGSLEGSFSVEDGSNYVTVTEDGVDYKGVIIEMDDEARNPVLCFSAVGDNNETIWGVHYLKEHTASYMQ